MRKGKSLITKETALVAMGIAFGVFIKTLNDATRETKIGKPIKGKSKCGINYNINKKELKRK
jgi:hypothetical protein